MSQPYSIPVDKHDNDRRTLTEWNKDIPMKRLKIIEAKGKKSVLGKHYHEKSDSIFYIFKGKGVCTLKPLDNPRMSRHWMFEGDCIFVPRRVVHTFELRGGTIMMEAASEPYDPSDEIATTD
jgi:mannose-6-phosphate isomerase-like protein (cupin superfamily)